MIQASCRLRIRRQHNPRVAHGLAAENWLLQSRLLTCSLGQVFCPWPGCGLCVSAAAAAGAVLDRCARAVVGRAS
eukprot:351934-Chlamydomonas_euryale.AAC.7